MRDYLRVVLRTTLWSTVAFALLGALAGAWLAFQRVPLIAEPGPKPADLSDYAFWIPAFAVPTALIGVIVGVVSGTLVFLVRRSERHASSPR